MAQTTVDHFYGMGKYSSQLSLSQKPFLLSFSNRQMMTLLYVMLGDNVLKINSCGVFWFVGLGFVLFCFLMREHCYYRVDMLWHYKVKNTE